MSRRYLVYASTCVGLPPREVVVMITKTGPGLDDKIRPVYMRKWSVTTSTAHPCVGYVWSLRQEVLSSFCVGVCSTVRDNQVRLRA